MATRAVKWTWRVVVAVLAVALAVGLAITLLPGVNAGSQVSPPALPTGEPSYAIPDRTEAPDPGISATPRRLRISSIGVNAEVVPYTAADAKQGTDPNGQSCYRDGAIRCVNPPDFNLVYQQIGGVDGVAYGENPGVNAGGTVYFFGHSATTRTGVFDKLPKLKKGDKAEVETDYGVITYVVDELLYIPKDEYTKTDKITEQTPGRLLLVSCDQAGPQYSNGYSKDNLVAVLHVEGARAL